jgi:Bacterial putative lipoprotein (DUF940).
MSLLNGTKNLIFSLIACSSLLFSNDYLNYNLHGTTGVINTPNARFLQDGYAGISISREDPLNKISVIASPFPWLETSFFYADFTKKDYGQQFGNNQSFKDKGFNFKIRLKEEDELPAIAIGAYDFMGTGWFSSEYLVMSKSIDNFDISAGLGWGKLSGGRYAFENPLIRLDEDFRDREKDTSLGGTFNTDYYFSGNEVSPFFSLRYFYDQKTILGFEYDPTKLDDFERNIEFPSRESQYSFFINRKVIENGYLKISYIRGSSLNLSFEYKHNYGRKKLSKNYIEP